MKMKNEKVKHLLKSKEGEVLRLSLGGDRQIGFMSMALDGDIKHDPETIPFPLPDNAITIVKILHVVERINPKDFIKWMDELWRVMKFDGQLLISTFYAGSAGYWADPFNVNGCTNETWYYFDPLHSSGLYSKYKPMPWMISTSFANPDGIMEVLLIKRRVDSSYKK